MNYYNEIDPFAADWLCQLINAGHIAPGVVDTRSIEDITPYELREFTQCHFFAGIGVWSYAFRQAGWPDDRPVWTGSCPCQPFSAAGKGKGFTDERHLWPAFFHLIEQCKPVTVFGEQVASKDGLAWLDLVQTDLEGAGYTVGAVDSCAAGFGAPHLRQRLYWVADSYSTRCQKQFGKPNQSEGFAENGPSLRPGPVNGFWGIADWLFCRDEKWRSVEPGAFPLVDRLTGRVGHCGARIEAESALPRSEKGNRVGRLRGYGNAIVAPQAKAFIEAFMETEND